MVQECHLPEFTGSFAKVSLVPPASATKRDMKQVRAVTNIYPELYK